MDEIASVAGESPQDDPSAPGVGIKRRLPQSSSEQDATDNVRIKKNKKWIFPYGNYHTYYGYRIDKALEADPRVKLMRPIWFEDKDVLDIGCNIGIVTIALAQEYRVRSMCGVDIDPGLINKAWKNLLHESGVSGEDNVERLYDWSDYVEKKGRHNKGWPIPDSDKEEETSSHGVLENDVDASSTEANGGLKGEELLKRVIFKNANFLHCNFRSNMLHTVLCLSVVKWIHLNWGDKGLLEFFRKIYNILCPGGVLILEPQPWRSYEKNHLVSEVVRQNFKLLTIRPEGFSQILLEQIGFKACEQITLDVPQSKQGFSRPLYLYTK